MSKQGDDMFGWFSRRVRPDFVMRAYERYFAAKDWLLNGVKNHPLSQDIESHAPSSRLGSATGTMFGFIGFEAGRDPVDELVNFLDENIDFFESAGTSRNKLVSVSISIPGKRAFSDDRFKLDWTDTPWPILVENGISGLQHYINKGNGVSRSEEGVQTKKIVRSSDYNGEEYLTPLLAGFRKRLSLR